MLVMVAIVVFVLENDVSCLEPFGLPNILYFQMDDILIFIIVNCIPNFVCDMIKCNVTESVFETTEIQFQFWQHGTNKSE